MQTKQTQRTIGSHRVRWLHAVALLIGCPMIAAAAGGYELTSGKIAVVSSIGWQGDGGYALSYGSIPSVPSDSISPTARMAACMNWNHSVIPAACTSADLDGDGDVDLYDFAELQNGFTNP